MHRRTALGSVLRAGVAESADAQLSKSCEVTRAGSSPASGTNFTSTLALSVGEQLRHRLLTKKLGLAGFAEQLKDLREDPANGRRRA